MTRLVTVNGRFSRWMSERGWAGVTLPGPLGVLILFWGEPALHTIRHEWRHAQQALELGWIRWWARYAWLWLRYGYDAHPMERDARLAEGD